MGKYIKTKLNEYRNDTITLYHGTCLINAQNLVQNGWQPNKTTSGSNQGNPSYLYLTTDPEDALWFAEEKGCDSIIIVSDIPLSYLRPDPEDEAGFSMSELLNRKNGLPSKFILIKELGPKHFSIQKRENHSEQKFAYHITRRENLPSIYENGLEARVPVDYGEDGDIKGVYLFKTLDDAKNALFNWFGERIEEWEEENDEKYDEVALKVNIEGLDANLIDSVEYEWTCLIDIEPSRIVNVFEI